MRILFEDTTYQPTDSRLRLAQVRWDSPGTKPRDLWFRFWLDPDDLMIHVAAYPSREGAVSTPQPRRDRVAWAQMIVPDPGDTFGPFSLAMTDDPDTAPDLTGLVVAVATEANVPADWLGCVWGYTAPTGNHVLDATADALNDHTAPGQSLEGLAYIGTEASGGSPDGPRVDLAFVGFTPEPPLVIHPLLTLWQGTVELTAKIRVPTTAPWWRRITQYAAAVRSILADEVSSSLGGVRRITVGQGVNARNGEMTLTFRASVIGQNEVFNY